MLPARTSPLPRIPQLYELRHDLADALVYGFLRAVDRDIGALGRFVRIAHTREILELSGERLLVQALDVALGEHVDGAMHVDLDEPGAALRDVLADLVADV